MSNTSLLGEHALNCLALQLSSFHRPCLIASTAWEVLMGNEMLIDILLHSVIDINACLTTLTLLVEMCVQYLLFIIVINGIRYGPLLD